MFDGQYDEAKGETLYYKRPKKDADDLGVIQVAQEMDFSQTLINLLESQDGGDEDFEGAEIYKKLDTIGV